MEWRNLAIFFGLAVLAVSQCSEAHSMHRRETDKDYDLFADAAADEDELQNDDQLPDEKTSESEMQIPEIEAKMLTQPQVYEVKKGEDVRLECNVDPANKTVAQWYKGNDLYFMNVMRLPQENVDLSRYSIVSGSKDLLIQSVQESDEGDYKCQIPLLHTVSVEHKLKVVETPQIVQFVATNGGIVAEGQNLLLTCDVIGRPPPQIIWTREIDNANQRLSEKDGDFSQTGTSGSVYIESVSREHTGKYYCYALNSAGSDQKELQVSIAGKPKVHVHKSVVNSDVNIAAVLECASHYDAKPHFRWYKNGVLIEDSSSDYVVSTHGPHSNLTVVPKNDADFGTFTCEAENEMGKHNRSIELVERPVVESLSSEDGTISWTVKSYQPLLELAVQLKALGQDDQWKQLDIPLPSTSSHYYGLRFDLNDKLDAGQYQAIVKARNDYGYSDNVEPVVVTIDVQPSMSIQTASVFRGSSSNAHSIRPWSAMLSTILMYLLVRTA